MDKNIEVAEWFVYAERDKDTACFLQNMKPCPYEIICYHCQQSAEKYLKGYLISKGQSVIKTHDLAYLIQFCIKLDTSFEQIVSQCEDLTDYAITTRYPAPIELIESDMHKALLDCADISSFILNKLAN